MIKNLFYIFVIGSILFIGCIRNDSDQNDKAFFDLNERFPEFPKNTSNSPDFYKLIRSVKNGQKGFEVQLYSAPAQKDKDNDEILVLINNLGERYAIPLFSNNNKVFWDFEFENNDNSQGLTFKSQLIKALDTLQLNDSLRTAQYVINEIFHSLLHLSAINKCDISDTIPFKLIEVPDKVNHPESYSCEYDCRDRIKKIDSVLIKSFDLPKKENHSYPIFIDFKRNRVYQMDYRWFGKIDTLTIRVYRIDCKCDYIGIIL